MCRSVLRASLLLLLTSVWCVGPAWAQEDAFARGLEAYQSGHIAQAEVFFARSVQADSAYRDGSRGSAAFWLGQARLALRDSARARAAFQHGLGALEAAGRSEVQLADALLHLLSAGGVEADETAEAVRAYQHVLNGLDEGPLNSGEQEAVASHLERLALVLPEQERDRILMRPWGERSEQPARWNIRRGAGARLLRWWRSQDPLPATLQNERLAEHLQRAAYATVHYGWDGRRTGLDDRGEIYIRYGPPARRRVVELKQQGSMFLAEGGKIPPLLDVVMREPGISLAGIPTDNELWLYPHIDSAAYFLFIESGKKGSPYLVGETNDLIPPVLRHQRHARAAYQALRMIYSQLAYEHGDFGARYEDILRYPTQPLIMRPQLRQFVQTRLSDSRVEDFRAARRREAVPRQATSMTPGAALPVDYRVARFLDEDGSTRTEVYWGLEPGALWPSETQQEQILGAGYAPGGSYLLRYALARQDADYRNQVLSVDHQIAGPEAVGPEATLPAEAKAIEGGRGLYHLSMQWEQYLPAQGALLKEGKERYAAGPLVKRTVARVDSLRALPAAESRLVVSDLRPMLVPETALADIGDPGAAYRLVYPYRKLQTNAPLALYFEIYGLNYGEDDRTHYAVNYEVYRRKERGGLVGLFRGDEEARTSTETAGSGTSRKAEQFIRIDLSEVEQGAGELVVTVRVTDEVSGQQTERSIAFALISSLPPD